MRRFFTAIFAITLINSVFAADEPAHEKATAEAMANADAQAPAPSPYAPAVFKIIEATQHSLDEMYDPIESEMAEVLKNASKQILAHPDIFKSLTHNAEMRFAADKASEEETVEEDKIRYAKLAMAGLQTSLRMTPGVMTRQELIDRAQLIAAIARYYDRKDSTLCRYLPQDFSVLLNVDAPWVEEVDQELLEKGIAGERAAILRMHQGVSPIVIADVDVQNIFSKFAAEWFAGLLDQERSAIALARVNGNYCPLWGTLLKDSAKMTQSFPKASQKVLLPLLTMPTRGWLDVGSWSVVEQASEPAEQ